MSDIVFNDVDDLAGLDGNFSIPITFVPAMAGLLVHFAAPCRFEKTHMAARLGMGSFVVEAAADKIRNRDFTVSFQGAFAAATWIGLALAPCSTRNKFIGAAAILGTVALRGR